jgi:hypothetical protein
VKSTTSRKCRGVAERRAAAPGPVLPQTPKRPEPTAAERRAADFSAGPAQASAPGTRDHTEAPAMLETTAGRVSAAVLTGGAVIWLAQSTLWTSLLILGLPLWRHVDLLPIVDRAADEAPATPAPKRDASEEQAVAAVLDAQRPQRNAGADPP